MILLDANVLIYAYIEEMPQHEKVRRWLDERLAGAAPVGIPWPVLVSFTRISCHRKVFDAAPTVVDAWRQARRWLAWPVVWTPTPTDRHAEILADLLPHTGRDPDLIPDAHLAALAIEHGLAVASADRDFARFPDLRWINPLAA